MDNMLYDTATAPIGAGFFDKNAFRKKAQLILVLKTGLAGLVYRAHEYEQGAQAFYQLLEQLEPGTELKLYREPDNVHDEWAIQVFTQDDVELGYISRFKNETIARLMDEGKKFMAYVDEKQEESDDPEKRRSSQAPTEDFRMPVAIYMED